MGLLSDIKKRFNAVPSNGLDGYGERSTSQHGARGRSAHASQHAGRGMSSSRQASRRPHGPDASSGSQDSGVVMHKESSVNLSSVPDYACPNCAAAAAARHAHPRPSMEAMQAYSSSKALPPLAHDHRMPDMSHDHSRPGTGYSNNSVLQPMQSQPYRQQPPHQNHDPGFSSRPVSWGRRATTENVGQDVPSGYSRPVTPPYSVTSEQTGWNSGQQYNNIPGPPSLDGRSNNRPVSWRRATDQRGPGYYPDTAGSSRAPSEAGSNHPRNQSKNMESSAYEAGFRDAIARLRADAERW